MAAIGTYTSSVRDAQTSAGWGRLSWVGEGAIELQTRSGNTSNPDSTWSDWSAPISGPDGDAIKKPSGALHSMARHVEESRKFSFTASA